MDPNAELRNLQFLFYGFAAAWAVLAIYLIVLTQRNRAIRRELERVRRMMDDRRV